MSVMDEYIKIVQDAITKYLNLVFERKFNKQICDSYIKTYIDVRYYNVNEQMCIRDRFKCNNTNSIWWWTNNNKSGNKCKY